MHGEPLGACWPHPRLPELDALRQVSLPVSPNGFVPRAGLRKFDVGKFDVEIVPADSKMQLAVIKNT